LPREIRSGRQQIDDQLSSLAVEGARSFADHCDIEASHYEEATRLHRSLAADHFLITTSKLRPNGTVYDRVTALPAVHKIVTQANDITDSLAVRLLDRGIRDGKKLIALEAWPESSRGARPAEVLT
jgi:hypothetical protein